MLDSKAWGPEFDPQNPLFSLKWAWGPVIIILLLESQTQSHLGLANRSTGPARKIPGQEETLLNNNKKARWTEPKEQQDIDLWPQHVHTRLKKNPDRPALFMVACYPPFPEITVTLNFPVLLPVVLGFTTFVRSGCACCSVWCKRILWLCLCSAIHWQCAYTVVRGEGRPLSLHSGSAALREQILLHLLTCQSTGSQHSRSGHPGILCLLLRSLEMGVWTVRAFILSSSRFSNEYAKVSFRLHCVCLQLLWRANTFFVYFWGIWIYHIVLKMLLSHSFSLWVFFFFLIYWFLMLIFTCWFIFNLKIFKFNITIYF